jgi:C-terminal processing protease CtpA/Prc
VNKFFKTLNDSTCYLRIKSFNGSYARDIDSVVKANVKSIQSTPKLIIDLRGNGGGSDHCMSFLQPILYTNPVKNIGVDLLTTPDNTVAWDLIIAQYRNELPKNYLDNLLKKIHQYDGKTRATVNFAPDYTGTLPTVWANPVKVAIVIDGKCGSTTEEFLLFARQSKKTTMVGERSLGVLDYSNVVPRDFSCPPFTLHYPTTRSRRIDAGLGIDNKGIQPDIPLDLSKNNWLEALMKMW